MCTNYHWRFLRNLFIFYQLFNSLCQEESHSLDVNYYISWYLAWRSLGAMQQDWVPKPCLALGIEQGIFWFRVDVLSSCITLFKWVFNKVVGKWYFLKNKIFKVLNFLFYFCNFIGEEVFDINTSLQLMWQLTTPLCLRLFQQGTL